MKKVKSNNPLGRSAQFKPESAEQALLTVLINYFGGPSKLGAKVGVKKNLVVNWRARGSIPVARVASASKILKVSPFALAYNIWADVANKQQPEFKTVVNSITFLDDATKKYILKLPMHGRFGNKSISMES
jgi:uncharacterized membrane protein